MEVPINGQDEKYFYKIGEAAKKIGVEPSVIRYWETEFSFLKPYKSKSSHRLYSHSDIEKLLLVKDYLYDKKFTIEGARKALKSRRSYDKPQQDGLYECRTDYLSENKSKGGGTAGYTGGTSAEPSERELLKIVRRELNSLKSFLTSKKMER